MATATLPGGKKIEIEIVNGKTVTPGLPLGTRVDYDGGSRIITGGSAGNYGSAPAGSPTYKGIDESQRSSRIEAMESNVSSDPQPDPMEEVRRMQEALAAAQRQNRIAGLDKQRENALAQLDTEQSKVEPVFYNKRNQVAAQSEVSAKNFAQYMASRGIKGAAGAMPEIYRQAGLQGQIGALDQQEAGVLANIERQRGLVNTNYEADVANANADIESQLMQNQLEAFYKNREYDLQLGSLTGTIGDQRTLAGQQFDWSRASSNPEVRGRILANQRAELENAILEIEKSALPETLKLDAERLKQQVEAGYLDYPTALARLKQIEKQTANIGKLTPAEILTIINDETKDFQGEVARGEITKEKAMAVIEKYRNYPDIYSTLMSEIERVFPENKMYLNPLGPFQPTK